MLGYRVKAQNIYRWNTDFKELDLIIVAIWGSASGFWSGEEDGS